MSGQDSRLELDGSELRRLVDQAMIRIADHVDSLPRQPSANVEGAAELSRSLAEPLPETGCGFSELLDLIFDKALSKSLNTASPGYLAYIPGGGLLHSAVADLIATAVNRYVGVWIAAPGLAQLEWNVIRWFCDIVGFPRAAGGYLSSGGSLANFSAVVAARRDRLPDDFLKGTLYCSGQIHHSVQKAALLAGFPTGNVRQVGVDDSYRLRVDELRQRVEDDRCKGFRPFLVAASAGTVNTGAVDDLESIANAAERLGLWMHVDAAYGGFFMLTERGRDVMRGLERADSVTLDPHKGLFIPYGVGCLLVRDLQTLRRSHSVAGEYMPPLQDSDEMVDFCEISPELSRDFRGLRVWLPLKMLGVDCFRLALQEKLDLTDWAHKELQRIPRLEIPAEPQLSVVPFRLRPEGPELDRAGLDRLNARFLEEIIRPRRIHINATRLDGLTTLRLCILSFRTHRDRMEAGIEDIRRAAEIVLEEHQATKNDQAKGAKGTESLGVS